MGKEMLCISLGCQGADAKMGVDVQDFPGGESLKGKGTLRAH